MKEAEFIDLANAIAIPTEEKTGSFDRVDTFSEDTPENPIKSFGNPEPDPTLEENIKVSEVLNPKESAEVLIALIDSIQDIGFSAAYAIKLRNKFSKEERDQIDDLEKKIEDEKTKEEKHLESRFNGALSKILEKKNSLGFTEDERRQLSKPAELLIKKSGKDIPPGLALALVTAKIVGDRMIDFVWE